MNALLRRGVRLAFCATCNARERVIENHRCIVCGTAPALTASRQETACVTDASARG